MINEISYILFYVYLGLFSFAILLYLPRILYYIGAFIPVKRVSNLKKNHLAVVVCAKEEGEVVADVLESLILQSYDPDYFDIYVVTLNEDDPTVKVANRFDKTTVLYAPHQTSKAEALDEGLKAILKMEKKYDAFVFIDADNIADKDFLLEMNNALALDKQIIIGKKLIKNFISSLPSSRSFSSDSTSLTYSQIDELGNRARNILGAPIMLMGTGMMVRSDIIEANKGWPYRTLTEDYELGADAILKEWTSYYYPYAKVYTEEATNAKGAYRRRIRWIKGYSQVHSKYRKAIWKKKFPKGKGYIKIGYVFGRLPIYLMFISSLVGSVIGLVLFILSFVYQESYLYGLLLFLVPLVMAYSVLAIFNLVTVIAERKTFPISLGSKISLVLLSPFYNLTYIPIFLSCLFTSYDHFRWEKTPRIHFKKKD